MTTPQRFTDEVDLEVAAENQDQSTDRRFFSWHVVVLIIVAATALFARFFRGEALGFFEDDFFYYVQAAKMFALHGISSFDGIHLTNGYHPLWFLTIAALYRLFPGGSFFVAVQILTLLLLLWFYASSVSIFRHLKLTDSTARLAALLLSLHTLLLFRFGMEVTISLPFGMAMLAFILKPDFRWTGRQTFVYGLLACFTVLGRLDSALLIALLILVQTLTSTSDWSTRVRRIAIFSVAFAPFFLYLFINHHWFHSLLPVSGHAKQLKPLLPPSIVPLTSVFLPFDRMKAAFVYPAVVLLVAGFLRFLQTRTSFSARERAVYLPLLVFPIVHVATLSFLSDWTMWPWYFYALTYAALAALALLLRTTAPELSVPRPRPPALLLQLACVFYILYVGVYAIKKKPETLGTATSAFTLHHPGIYAMGDGSGEIAYLSNQPFIQLEGLMMDADHLNVVAQRTPIAQVLDRYHVRYYALLTATLNPPDHCYSLGEPAQAGPSSPRMGGRICAAPLASFEDRGTYVLFFDASAVR